MYDALFERLTFDTLFRISEPKRVLRSATVKGPPLEIDSFQNTVYYCFNFKSNPSTTGLRHRGYVKFFKPKNGVQKPLQHVECLVDCTCPDYKYRWAWANKQRGSGRVGTSSLNHAWNKAPRKTNPSGKSGLCKHILAARQYIYGLLSSFPSDQPDTSDKLNKLTKYAAKRWTDFTGQVFAAKQREKELAKARALRNITGRLPEPPAATTAVPKPAQVTGPNARTDEPEDKQEKTDANFKDVVPPKVPLVKAAKPKPAGPPTTVPKVTKPKTTVPPKLAAPPNQPGPGQPSTQDKTAPYGGYKSKAEYDFRRRQGLGDSLMQRSQIKSVVTPNNGNIMSNLNEAIKLVHEMEDDLLNGGAADAAGTGPETGAGAFDMAEPLEPSEPPVSDMAVGADTEGDTALGLLRQMKDLLTQIVTVVAPPEEAGEESAELEGTIGGADVEGTIGTGDMPPEGFSDEETPSEANEPEEEGGEEEDEEEEGDEKKKNPFESAPNRRPSK